MTPEPTFADEMPAEVPEPPRALFVLTGSVLAWAAATAALVLLRLGPIWHMPVAGPELVHLSGAWQARGGVEDDRFVGTLFQALAALLFRVSDSEIPARILAFCATATVPAAVWSLRSRLGDAGALIALALLAFDGPAIALGSSASAMGFDMAITAWLFAVISRPGLPVWSWAVAAVFAATAGPLVLPLVVGGLAVVAARSSGNRIALGWVAGGLAAGVICASLGFGTGPIALRVPPFWLFAASFDQVWSAPSALELGVLYVSPVILAGIAGAAVRILRMRREGADTFGLILIAWGGVALAWWLISASAQSPAPVVALTLPAALLAGPALAEGTDAMLRADWRWARFLIPTGLFLASIALVVMLTWARNGRPTDSGEKLLVSALLVLAITVLGLTAWQREAVPTLLAPALLVGALIVIPGGLGVSFDVSGEVTPSPRSPAQARQLRDTALQLVHDRSGLIVIHPRFEEAIAWPFRDSGDLVVASRVPGDANVLVWPGDLPKPDGFNPVQNDWNLAVSPGTPGNDFLVYLGWLSNRASLGVSATSAVLYVRAQ